MDHVTLYFQLAGIFALGATAGAGWSAYNSNRVVSYEQGALIGEAILAALLWPLYACRAVVELFRNTRGTVPYRYASDYEDKS